MSTEKNEQEKPIPRADWSDTDWAQLTQKQ
jgi:hypothetical protein